MVVENFCLLLLTQIRAVFISISNPGFEGNYPNCPNNTYWNYATIHGWNVYDPQAIMQHTAIGISNPTKCTQCGTGFGVSMNDSIFKDSAPEGESILFLHINATQQRKAEIGIEQSLPNYTLTANTRYTLTAYIGNPQDNCWTNSSEGANVCMQTLSGSTAYILQLLAGDTIIAQDNNSIAIPDGEWRMSRIQFEPLQHHPALGNALKIRLIHTNDATKNGKEIWFDHIMLQLNATISPSAAPTIGPFDDNLTAKPTLPELVAFYPTIHPTEVNVIVHETEIHDAGTTSIEKRYTIKTLYIVFGASLIVIICVIAALRMVQKRTKSALKAKETSVIIALEMTQTDQNIEDKHSTDVIEEVEQKEVDVVGNDDDDDILPENMVEIVRDKPQSHKMSRVEGEKVTETEDYVNHEDDELDDVSNTPDAHADDGDINTMQQTGYELEGNDEDNKDDDVVNDINKGKDGDVVDVINETAMLENMPGAIKRVRSISDLVCSLDR